MKQTTIRVYLEENICGVAAFAAPAKVTQNRIEYSPTEWDRRAWRVMAGEAAKWGMGIDILPKDGKPPTPEWLSEVSQRLVRVCKKRKFKTGSSCLDFRHWSRLAGARTESNHAIPVISACGDGRQTQQKETHNEYRHRISR
jgi:hypothetical protein